MSVTNFEIDIFSAATKLSCGVSSRRDSQIITNRPQAVRILEVENLQEWSVRDDYGSSRKARIAVDAGLLGDKGFVAQLVHSWENDNGGYRTRIGDTVAHIVGRREVTDADVFYGSAYQAWAESAVVDASAYRHLEWYGEQAFREKGGLPSKLRHSLEFATGHAHSLAPHDERRKAWVCVLRRFGCTDPKEIARISESVRTATVKAALYFGWTPPVHKPKPRPWKGPHPSLTIIDIVK